MASLLEQDSHNDLALCDGKRARSRGELQQDVASLAAHLSRRKITNLALYADNGIDFVVADLACHEAGITITPLPLFFSPSQIAHALACCGAQTLLCDRPLQGLIDPGVVLTREADLGSLQCYDIQQAHNGNTVLPPTTQKITFTSGTTGAPKGVCLSASNQMTVATSLADVVKTRERRHLCVLPLSTLLENIAGVYAPLFAGGTVIVPSLGEIGLAGSSNLDVAALLRCISAHRASSIILVPEMLRALVSACAAGWVVPHHLDFIAVGGGKVAPELLSQARAAGLPAFEGYGLSECASVVALNLPGAERPGTVGRPLDHIDIDIEDGEIVIASNGFLGYAGYPESWHPQKVRTGDLGRLDADGYLFIEGRKKNVMITSYGRNLSPEWVESELLAGPLLHQAVVFGDTRPFCVALVWPRDPDTTSEAVAQWIEEVNSRLPDYAQILDFAFLPGPLSAADQTATDNGRPRRDQVQIRYESVINGLYNPPMEASSQ